MSEEILTNQNQDHITQADLNQNLSSDPNPAMNKTDKTTSASDSTHPELDLLFEIMIKISVEVGGKSMKLKDLLRLNKNSIIELDKAAGEPLDIKANGSLIARGEIVIVNGKYGIRLTEITSKSERLNNL